MCKNNKHKSEPNAQNQMYYAGTADHVNNSLDKIIK